VGSCKYGNEPSGSGATELVTYRRTFNILFNYYSKHKLVSAGSV
jgi:hypothetical protein